MYAFVTAVPQFLSQLLKALDVLFQCFTRLDRRVTGVAQTAARISDQLQVLCSNLSCYVHIALCHA